MKISNFESGQAGHAKPVEPEARILPAHFKEQLRERKIKTRARTSREEAIEVAEAAVAQTPDVREDIVNELREKIAKGEYKVSGEDIAEMMIRRVKADRIR